MSGRLGGMQPVVERTLAGIAPFPVHALIVGGCAALDSAYPRSGSVVQIIMWVSLIGCAALGAVVVPSGRPVVRAALGVLLFCGYWVALGWIGLVLYVAITGDGP